MINEHGIDDETELVGHWKRESSGNAATEAKLEQQYRQKRSGRPEHGQRVCRNKFTEAACLET